MRNLVAKNQPNMDGLCFMRLLWSNLDLTSHNKAGLHWTFQKSIVEFLCTDFLIEFLCTDLDGNLSFTLNPLPASKLDHFYQHCLRDYQKLQPKAKCLINMCGMKKQASPHQWDSWHCIVCNTDSPIHIQNLFHKWFEKHSMLE